jgi:hypothetical protein
VDLPPGFTARLAGAHGDDPDGERLAGGIARTIEFTRLALTSLGIADEGATTSAAAHAFTSCFGFGLRHHAVCGRDFAFPRKPASWRGVIEKGVAAFDRSGGDFALLGETVALAAGLPSPLSVLPEDVFGILGVTLAVVVEARGKSLAPALARTAHDGNAGVGRLAAGRAYVGREMRAIALKLGASPDEAEAIADRAAAHYSAGFSCMLQTSNRGGVLGYAEHSECSGDGIRRAVAQCLEMLCALPETYTSLDRGLIVSDVSEICLRGSAGSFESGCAQGLAVIASLPLLQSIKSAQAVEGASQ